MPGPQPLPTNLKLLKGVKPYRINQKEANPRVASANLPSRWGAQMSQAAKGFWKRYAQKLIDLGLLTEIDLDTFRILCELIAERKQLSSIIKKTGYVYLTKNQYWETLYKQRPEVGMRDKIESQIYRYLQLFGMAPAPRGRIASEAPLNLDDEDLD